MSCSILTISDKLSYILPTPPNLKTKDDKNAFSDWDRAVIENQFYPPFTKKTRETSLTSKAATENEFDSPL